MIRKTLIYFFLVTAALYTLREFHYQGLLRQESGYYGKMKTAFLHENNFDVLFLGSSRAEMAYNTLLFDSLTGSNSFNLGLAGAGPRVAYSALCTYLSRSARPETIYYELDLHALRKKTDEIKEFNNYFPLLKDSVFRANFVKVDPRLRHFYVNPYYSWPFTGYRNISTSLHGWLGIPNKTDHLYHKGFLGEKLRPVLDSYEAVKMDFYIHPHERMYLDSIILKTKALHIELILITSPVHQDAYQNAAGRKALGRQLDHIAKAGGMRYLDLSSVATSREKRFFVDPYHLNYDGACHFTRQLAYLGTQ